MAKDDLLIIPQKEINAIIEQNYHFLIKVDQALL